MDPEIENDSINDNKSDESEQDTETLVDAVSEALELDTDNESDNETETETDSDTDTSTDTNAESDSTTDSDTDVDNDTETTADAESKSEPDTKSDNDNELYQEPEGLKEKGQHRFKELVSSHKEMTAEMETVTTERDQYQKDNDDFRQVIDYSQATPEEFQELVEFSHLVKNGQFEGAMTILNKQRAELARMIGKPIAGADQLSDYPDLQEQVDSLDITEALAHELAASRYSKTQFTKQQQQLEQESNVEQTQQQSISRATETITAMGNEWAKNDIDYQVKAPKLIAQAQIIAKNYPPELWAQALNDFYQGIIATAPTPTPKSKTPLRPAGSTGGTKEPANAVDAISQALGL